MVQKYFEKTFVSQIGFALHGKIFSCLERSSKKIACGTQVFFFVKISYDGSYLLGCSGFEGRRPEMSRLWENRLAEGLTHWNLFYSGFERPFSSMGLFESVANSVSLRTYIF